MNDGNVKLWLYLTIITGISKARLFSLYKHFKSCENIFAASKEALLSSDNLSEEEAEKIICPDFSYVEEYMGILNINRVKVLTIESPDYPEMLLDISNPPLLLYCRGNYIDLNKALCIAFVGTRKPTPYGRRMTYSIARELCQKGFVIVSGMAQGIDAVSHKAAIDMGCPTVAFIASGVDIIYPRINAELFRAILKNGMVVSEYPLGTMPKNYYFPERNRLVAGVSRGVFVGEAGEKSGTSITVSYGVSQGKDIFALPGNADSPMSEMPNKLIKDGAYLVTRAADISCHYEELYKDNLSYVRSFKKEGEIINLPPEENTPDINIPEGKTDEERVLNSLSSGGLSIDDISVLTKIKLEELNMMLLFLEMNGKIKSDNGIYYLL